MNVFFATCASVEVDVNWLVGFCGSIARKTELDVNIESDSYFMRSLPSDDLVLDSCHSATLFSVLRLNRLSQFISKHIQTIELQEVKYIKLRLIISQICSLFWRPPYNYSKQAFFFDDYSRGRIVEKKSKLREFFGRKIIYMKKTVGDSIESFTKRKVKKIIKTETNREVVRFQFEIDPELWKSLEFYQELGRIPTKRELLNNAISLFRWAAKHKAKGHSIVALDSNDKEYELELPCLDNIEVNSKQNQLRLVG